MLFKVTEVIKHTDYGIINSIPQNDIGILVLNGKIQYSSFIAPICLFDSLTLIDEHFGKKGLVLGWGLKTDNEISQYLNYGRMTFLTRSECSHSSLLFGLLPTSAFCASSNGTMQTVCSGDSGGGMVRKTTN